MKTIDPSQPLLFSGTGPLPDQMERFPRFRYMGSKFRLLPWIHDSFRELDFESVTDAFSGSGVVSYLLKGTTKRSSTL
jgi:DNA adenine methylase/adenine-specific DNA-methyltransferase